MNNNDRVTNYTYYYHYNGRKKKKNRFLITNFTLRPPPFADPTGFTYVNSLRNDRNIYALVHISRFDR